MMTLEQAIVYAEEKAEEHSQLAGWLKELKALRKLYEPVKPNITFGELAYDTWECPNCGQTYEIDEQHYFLSRLRTTH